MKQLLMTMILLILSCNLAGCAASYVRYEVSGMAGHCPPVVVADAAFGVKVQVNDEVSCVKEREDE